MLEFQEYFHILSPAIKEMKNILFYCLLIFLTLETCAVDILKHFKHDIKEIPQKISKPWHKYIGIFLWKHFVEHNINYMRFSGGET